MGTRKKRPDLAFVLILHLDPNHESMMPEILQVYAKRLVINKGALEDASRDDDRFREDSFPAVCQNSTRPD